MHLLVNETLDMRGVRDASRPGPRVRHWRPLGSLESSIGGQLLETTCIDSREGCEGLQLLLLLLLEEELGQEPSIESLEECRVKIGRLAHHRSHAQIASAGRMRVSGEGEASRVDHQRGVERGVAKGGDTQGRLEGREGMGGKEP